MVAPKSFWMLFKNFSNNFSISNVINGGNNNGSSNDRRNISYNRLKTHDKSDCLSSSNPNLLDLLAPHQTNNNDEDDYEEDINSSNNITRGGSSMDRCKHIKSASGSAASYITSGISTSNVAASPSTPFGGIGIQIFGNGGDNDTSGNKNVIRKFTFDNDNDASDSGEENRGVEYEEDDEEGEVEYDDDEEYEEEDEEDDGDEEFFDEEPNKVPQLNRTTGHQMTTGTENWNVHTSTLTTQV